MSLNKFEENGVTYFQLYIRCPVCIGLGKADLPATYWVHGNEGCCGDIYVGDNAYYKCVKCGQLAHVANCGYKSPCNSSVEDYFVMFESSSSLGDSVSVVGQLVKETGNAWLRRFLENMGDW